MSQWEYVMDGEGERVSERQQKVSEAAQLKRGGRKGAGDRLKCGLWSHGRDLMNLSANLDVIFALT